MFLQHAIHGAASGTAIEPEDQGVRVGVALAGHEPVVQLDIAVWGSVQVARVLAVGQVSRVPGETAHQIRKVCSVAWKYSGRKSVLYEVLETDSNL